MKRQKTGSVLGKRKYDEMQTGISYEEILEQRYYPYLYF